MKFLPPFSTILLVLPLLAQAVDFNRDIGLVLPEGKGIKATDFEVAGEDGKWHPAETFTVYGHHVMARSKEVKKPVNVRFGWDQLATPNLMNRAGLPASPFTSKN